MGEILKKESSEYWRIPKLQLNTIHQIASSNSSTKTALPALPKTNGLVVGDSQVKMKWRRSVVKAGVIEKFSQKQEYRKREKEISDQDKLLRNHQEVKVVKSTEKQRQKNFRLKQKAAFRIQKAWKKYKMRQFGILTVAKQSIHQLQTQAGAEEFQKQIAALTIQLAWRKYYRRKLLRSLTPNRRQLHLWDPEVIAMKQKALVKQIYAEAPPVPFWHPEPKRPPRPYWSKWIPSAAALSYNFAVDRYHPLVSKKGFLPSPFIDNQGYPKNFDWNPLEDEELANNLRNVRVPNTTTARSRQYSYNISRGGNGYRSSTFI